MLEVEVSFKPLLNLYVERDHSQFFFFRVFLSGSFRSVGVVGHAWFSALTG